MRLFIVNFDAFHFNNSSYLVKKALTIIQYLKMSDNPEAGDAQSSSSLFKFIKKPTRKFGKLRQKRERNDSDSDSSSDDNTQVVTLEKKQKKNPLVQSTSSFAGTRRKQTITGEDDEEVAEFPLMTSFKSTKSGERDGPTDMGATATIEIDTDKEKDARAIFEKAREVNDNLKDKEDDKVYRGMNNYKQFIQVKDSAQGNAASAAVRKGPIRAPENIRSTVRWDYQPNICKDYKETGFCGFGDSCIFLHDRTDYKQGWQLELEAAKGTYGAEDEDDGKYEINDDEKLPFKCLICRKSFVKPIVTKCKHYFCEKCALDHYRKSTRCIVCGIQTQGIFNPAKEISKRLNIDNRVDDQDEEAEDNDGEKVELVSEFKIDSDCEDVDEDE